MMQSVSPGLFHGNAVLTASLCLASDCLSDSMSAAMTSCTDGRISQ